MGCDIHLIAEIKQSWGWKRIYPAPAEREVYHVERMAEEESEGWGWNHAHAMLGWYHERNYALFGILADVRGDGPPIAAPRGYPEDLSPEGKHWASQYDNGCAGECVDISPGEHSFSWLTLAELQAHEPQIRSADEDFATRVIPALAKRGKPHEVRIVFGFDS